MTAYGQKILGDEWLSGFAAGGLPEAHEILVASHLELNPKARAAYRMVEAAGGALLEGLEPAGLNDNAFKTLLGRLEDKPARGEPPKTAAPTPDYLPKALQGYFDSRGMTLKWKPLGPGMKRFPIITGETGEKLWLLKAKPGAAIPEHGHSAGELTLVLTGKLVDGKLAFGRGEVEEADQEVEHQPEIAPGEDCICLVVTEGPIRFKGLIARALQPLTGL